MKSVKICIFVILLVFLVIGTSPGKEPYPEPKLDELYASYPKYRIDNKIKKICIIGTGTGNSEIQSHLTNLMMKKSDIKVIEPGNLQAILGGKILEYKTGLGSAESRAMVQMFQVDHIMLFEEKISPYRDYQYGGRAYNQINLKIMNTVTGEIIFQTSSNMGVVFKDPRPYGYRNLSELSTSQMNNLRTDNYVAIDLQLIYALGNVFMGFRWASTTQAVVGRVILNSPVYKAGMRRGDKILEVNGRKIDNPFELNDYIDEIKPKQGDRIKIKIEREGKSLDVEMMYPVIPFSPEETKTSPQGSPQNPPEPPKNPEEPNKGKTNKELPM